jgi:ketosteroid isomerase-like protein
VNVACSVHHEFKKISLGNQKPQDLVRLGPGVVSDPDETEVCVACDVVVFVNVVPFDALRKTVSN